MSVAVLLGWLLSAGVGLRLLVLWSGSGRGLVFRRLRDRPEALGYLGAFTGGGVAWLSYLLVGSVLLIWLTLLLLLVALALGQRLLLWWLDDQSAGNRLPGPLVYAHGVGMVTTAVLVVLVALGL